ncbi:MAG: glycosyltransferase family 39 protein [Burkholderiaceae bacterium]|nr:glycosyltransferase family 39 protein [Burkholderiaceae bacterium]
MSQRLLSFTVVLALVLVVYRSVSGFFAPLPLQVDEAQYLGWAQDLAFGYYSKPPMIAWMLGANRVVCDAVGLGGFANIEGCARMSQAFALGLAALFAAATSWALFASKPAAMAAALILALSPLFGFYSLFATTDAWLLMCWSVALWSFVKATVGWTRGLGLWVVCGVAVGLGLLSKYSMGVFVISAFIALAMRRELLTPGPWLAALVAGFVFLPNLIWNVQHGFPTFAHHIEISQVQSLAESGWSLARAGVGLGEFAGAQFLLIGPFAMISLLLFLPRHLLGHRAAISKKFDLLLAFALPMLAMMLVQAASSRAHANWAAPAYLSLAVFIGFLWADRDRFDLNSRLGPAFLWASLAFGLMISLLLIHGLKFSYSDTHAPKIRAVEKLRGWKEAAQWVANTAKREGVLVTTDDRRLLAITKAYTGVTLYAFDAQNRRQHHYTWFYNLADQKIAPGQRILVILIGKEDSEAVRNALGGAGFGSLSRVEDPQLDQLRLGDAGDKLLAYWASR